MRGGQHFKWQSCAENKGQEKQDFSLQFWMKKKWKNLKDFFIKKKKIVFFWSILIFKF